MTFLVEPIEKSNLECGPCPKYVDPDCCHGGDACPAFYS